MKLSGSLLVSTALLFGLPCTRGSARPIAVLGTGAAMIAPPVSAPSTRVIHKVMSPRDALFRRRSGGRLSSFVKSDASKLLAISAKPIARSRLISSHKMEPKVLLLPAAQAGKLHDPKS